MFGLREDLEALSDEEVEVAAALTVLDKEIEKGIDSYSLVNGSHFRPSVLDELDADQRRRVISRRIGRYYERTDTHTQFVLRWDEQEGAFVLLAKELHRKHLCIPEIKKAAEQTDEGDSK